MQLSLRTNPANVSEADAVYHNVLSHAQVSKHPLCLYDDDDDDDDDDGGDDDDDI